MPPGIDQSHINAAIAPDPAKKAEAESNPQSQIPKTKHRILSAVKGVFHGGVSTGLGADRLAARVGVSEGAKFREGVVRTGPSPESGPTRFPARFQGKEGYAVVTGPVVGWAKGNVNKEEEREMDWTLRIGEVHVSLVFSCFILLFFLSSCSPFRPSARRAGHDADVRSRNYKRLVGLGGRPRLPWLGRQTPRSTMASY